MSVIQQKGFKMAMIDDDDDIEALRLAALQTIRPRRNQFGHNGRFHRQNDNPNLISIVPQTEKASNEFGTETIKGQVPSKSISPLKATCNVSDHPSSLKTIDLTTSSASSTSGEIKESPDSEVKKVVKQEESNANDGIDTAFEEKLDFEEDDESEEDHDFVSLDDEDMSLEKLMDQMEQEFSQCNGKTSKKTKSQKKTKSKSSVNKNKDSNKKNSISDNKTNNNSSNTESVSSSTLIGNVESRNKSNKNESSELKSRPVVDISSTMSSKTKISEDVKINLHVSSKSKQFCEKSRSRSPIRYSRSPVRRRSPCRSPKWSPKGKRSPSPKYKRESPKKYMRSLTPRRKSLSPRRSPVRKYRGSPKRSPSPRRRRRSPMRVSSPVRKSPLRTRSPSKKSPIRAGSPSRRKSPLRRKSPYRPISPAMRKSPYRGSSPRRKSPYRSLSPTRRKSPLQSSSPNKRKSPLRNFSPGKRKSPYRGSSPKRKSPYRGMSPGKRKSPFRHSSPYRKSPYRGSSPYKRKSPVRGGSPGRRKSPFRSGSLSRYRDGSPQRRKSPYKDSSPPKRKSPGIKSPLRKSPLSPRRKHSSPYPSLRQKKSSPSRYESSRRRGISPSRNGSPHRTPGDSPRKKSPSRQSPLRKRPVSPVKNPSPSRKAYSPIKSPVRRRRKSHSPSARSKKYDLSQSHVCRSKVSTSKKPRLSDPENEENLRSSRNKKLDEAKEVNLEKIDPVLEARRRKFESNNIVSSLNKTIRLKPLSENELNTVTTKVSSLKKAEKSVSTTEVKEKPKEDVKSKCDFSTQVTLENDLPPLKEVRAGKISETTKKEKGKISRKIIKRKTSESEKEDVLSRRKKISVNIRPTAIQVLEEKSKRISERQLMLDRERRKVISEDEHIKPERVSVMSDRWKSRSDQSTTSDKNTDEDVVDSKGPDLRAELSRRRAQRLKGIGSMGPSRLVQSALEGVVKKKDEEKIIMQLDTSELKKKSRMKTVDLISSSSSMTKPRRVLLHHEHPTLNISDSEESEDSVSSDEEHPVQKGRSILSRNQV